MSSYSGLVREVSVEMGAPRRGDLEMPSPPQRSLRGPSAQPDEAEREFQAGERSYWGFDDGEGLESLEDAVRHYQRSRELGHAGALGALGWITIKGVGGIKRDVKSGLAMVKESERRGHVAGALALGRCYYCGVGTQRKLQHEAMGLISSAAEQSYPPAMETLGMCYLSGDGVEKNPSKAFELILRASELGMPQRAPSILGKCYARGDGVGKDEDKARVWCAKADEQRRRKLEARSGWVSEPFDSITEAATRSSEGFLGTLPEDIWTAYIISSLFPGRQDALWMGIVLTLTVVFQLAFLGFIIYDFVIQFIAKDFPLGAEVDAILACSFVAILVFLVSLSLEAKNIVKLARWIDMLEGVPLDFSLPGPQDDLPLVRLERMLQPVSGTEGVAVVAVRRPLLKSIRRWRFLIWLRSFDCVLLALVGVLFIATSDTLSDIILNTLGFVFISEFDDLAYNVFAGSFTRYMTENLAYVDHSPSSESENLKRGIWPCVKRISRSYYLRFLAGAICIGAWSIGWSNDIYVIRTQFPDGALGVLSFVGNGEQNTASGDASFVGNGFSNTASGFRSSVVGGEVGIASGVLSFIGNGAQNTASGIQSFVGNGFNNTASGLSSSVVGGEVGIASGVLSFIGNGAQNTASGDTSFVGNGFNNTASGLRSSVVGGQLGIASGVFSFIGNGAQNTASGIQSFIGNGFNNTASGLRSSVVGGQLGIASGDFSFVGNGAQNTASGVLSFIGNGAQNTASGDTSFVGNGFINTASGLRSSVVGGEVGIASGDFSFIGNGVQNTASGKQSFVGNGFNNTASGLGSSIVTGRDNRASGNRSSVGGGQLNVAEGVDSSISGGFRNTASGRASVASGFANSVVGNYSFVAGYNATSDFDHSAVFGFQSSNAPACTSNGPSTVTVCAPNGFFVNGVEIGTERRRTLSEGTDNSFEQGVIALKSEVEHSKNLLRVNMEANEALRREVFDLRAQVETLQRQVTDVMRLIVESK